MAAPEASGAMPAFCFFRTIVTCPNDDGVIADAQLINGIEDLARSVIDLGQHISVVSVARLGVEIGMRQRWQMRLSKGHVGEEGCVRLHITLHKVGGACNQLSVNCPAGRHVVFCDNAGLLSFDALHDVGHMANGRVELGVACIQRLIRRIWDAIPLVKPLVDRQTAWCIPQMPLAEHAGRVSSCGKLLSDGFFPLCHPVQHSPHDFGRAGADGMAARHQCRTARRALGLDVEVEQTHAFDGQLIKAWRFGASQGPASVDTDFPPTEVIDHHKDDVGL